LKSIRWRLPLNFLGIAGLTVIILGTVLVAVLRAYYTGVEQEFLRGTSSAMPPNIVEILESDDAQTTLQEYFDNVAFLSQTRVRVIDPEGEILVDTGSPMDYDLAFRVQGDSRTPILTDEGTTYPPLIIERIMDPEGERLTVEARPAVGDEEGVVELPAQRVTTLDNGAVAVTVPLSSSAFGFNVGRQRTGLTPRSSQEIVIPIFGTDGLLGYIEFSDGPAYGQNILSGVSIGFLLAGLLTLGLAAIVGWLFSQRLSSPLIRLTQSTSRIAGGDYSSRVQVDRQDELGTLARTFNHMAEKIEGTVAALRRFVSDAAHEINTPLTALRTNLELAAKERSKRVANAYIEQALEQAMKLEGMTNSLLDLSRLEAGETEEGLETLNLSALIREQAERYASRADQKGVSFTLDLPDVDVDVRGRSSQLRIALRNLLDNAVKFTPAEGSISMGLRSTQDAVEAWVEDSGIGIPADEINKLFQRFHRARNAYQYPGNGLGLTIVKSIAEGHGGSVRAERIEQGTRFVLSIPKVEDHTARH
jgi:signal transduction histidine kinase